MASRIWIELKGVKEVQLATTHTLNRVANTAKTEAACRKDTVLVRMLRTGSNRWYLGKITRGTPKPFAERVEDFIARSLFSLVWSDEIEIINRVKSGEIFCQKHPTENRSDPFSPKAFFHKSSTRSTNCSGHRVLFFSGTLSRYSPDGG
jgi:hypothetical protein